MAALVKTVAVKNEEGTLGNDYKFGTTFEEVIDGRASKGGYSLAQFFDNYMDFMNNSFFVYRGENEVTNTKMGVWIDTGETQNIFN